MDIGQRVDEDSAGIKEKLNVTRLTREEKVAESFARLDRLSEQSAEHFEWLKDYLERQQEETRRYVAALIERAQLGLSTQGWSQPKES